MKKNTYSSRIAPVLFYILCFCSIFQCSRASVVTSNVLSNQGVLFNSDSTQLVYKKVDGKELGMSVFLPDNYNDSNESFPCMVIFHGGSWNAGDVNWHFPDCEYWSKRGMIAVSVDYRLRDRDGVEVPLECVKDAKSAVRFLREYAEELKVDTARIVSAGGSAGGQLAAALAMITNKRVNHSNDDLSVSCIPNAVILWNPWFKCEEWLSPTYHVQEALPAFCIFSGGADPAIPVQEMIDFHQSLKAAKNSSVLYIGKEGKHGFCNGRNRTNRFFYWSLELEDQFLVKSGILTGTSLVEYPSEVKELQQNEFNVYN